MTEDLPYRCEYAKSGRAGCKGCKSNIEKETLRLAVMVQSPFFDGKTPNWYHYACFFKRFRPSGPEEIAYFSSIKFEDQQTLNNLIAEAKGLPPATNGKSRKRKADPPTKAEPQGDFTVEYAKSNRAGCKLCEDKIEKGQIRIGKLDRDSEDARRYGPLNRWFHVDCFVSAREELEFFISAEMLQCFDTLEKKDKNMLTKKLPELAGKKPKVEIKSENNSKQSTKEQKSLKKQSDLIFKFVDELKKMRKKELLQFYEHNRIEVPHDTTERINFIADALAFGVTTGCPDCGARLRFKGIKYKCTGHNSEWGRCPYTTQEPKRQELKIPKDLLVYTFLKKYKYKNGKRIYDTNYSSVVEQKESQELLAAMNVDIKKEDYGEGTSSNGLSAKPLSGYNIAILGTLKNCKDKIAEFGAEWNTNYDRTVLCIIADETTYDKKSKIKKFAVAEQNSIPVVSENFFSSLTDNGGNIKDAILNSKINLWKLSENDLQMRVLNLNVRRKIESAFKSGGHDIYKSGKSKSVMKCKSGAVVDSESGLEDEAHILREGNNIYSATLNRVDITRNKNSFYKIQLLEDDRTNSHYWVFRSWGRVGTTIGNTKLDRFNNKMKAILEFKELYLAQTGNEWDYRSDFKKKPNMYFPVDVDYGDDVIPVIDLTDSTSTLHESVKSLISLIFDVQKMKQTMMEFELDLEKMPLGKLSKNQLLNACSTLKEISNLISVTPPNLSQLTAAWNKFYTLVPHNFGISRPPIVVPVEEINKKMEMLEALMEIELAYEIIQNQNTGGDGKEDPIDFHYKKLNTDIVPLDKTDQVFSMIQKYIQNTHAGTHSMYKLEVMDVFQVDRQNEDSRFKKFQSEPERMLLWHGSRITNYAGILSQGLRIAPPEAPCTGYMFGKGVYFADSVSKSANYCNSSSQSDVGLLLLSEVAIGKSLELTQAKYVDKLEKDYLSVKGIGGSHPNPKQMETLADGVKVPLGKMIKNKEAKDSNLLYNEYIVYNEEQIRLRYLVKVKFNYNSLF